MHFRDQEFKFLEERGTSASHSGIEEGPLPTPHTARVPRFDCLCRSTPLAVFEQFEHCTADDDSQPKPGQGHVIDKVKVKVRLSNISHLLKIHASM